MLGLGQKTDRGKRYLAEGDLMRRGRTAGEMRGQGLPYDETPSLLGGDKEHAVGK